MALELTMRHGTVRSPLLVVPTPDFKTHHYHRQNSDNSSDTQLSPNDTPRKNKRKLSEPRRRTTDFSIKRLCPDSPGSACSESGRSEESAESPERLHDVSRDLPDSPSTSPTQQMPIDTDRLLQQHPHLRPQFAYPDMPHHPYAIPPFFYGRLPGFPFAMGGHHMPAYPDVGAMAAMQNPLSVPRAPVKQQQQHQSRQSSQESPRAQSPSPPPKPRHVAKKKSKERPSVPAPTPVLRSSSPKPSEHDEDSNCASPQSPDDGKKCRKNYKNMTRERRVEANARERTRVHTISAAFDGLRRAVPSYSYNQKLSKLAILRIACSYINALSKLADPDDERDSSMVPEASFAECVDNCTRTIQTEGKARRRH